MKGRPKTPTRKFKLNHENTKTTIMRVEKKPKAQLGGS
jgi:hypothetical protein